MLNVGVIGCGRIAAGFDDDPKRTYPATHLGAYRQVKQTRVVALCDTDAEKLARCRTKWGVVRGYGDFKELLHKETIDVLSICTLPDTHCAIIREAVKHKSLKAIFCEKPIASTSRDVGDLLDVCRQRNVILQIDHQRRFDPLHLKLREMIRGEKFGAVQQANFYYTAGISNTGTHMFDLLRFLFGEAAWVEAFFSKNLSSKDNDPNLDGVLKFTDGTLVTFQACDVKNYLVFELNCFLTRARFVLKNSGFTLDFLKAKPSAHFSGYRELVGAGSPVQTEYQRNFMVNAVKHLVTCIKTGQPSRSSGEDGLAALKLIEAAMQSAQEDGRRVFLGTFTGKGQ